MRGHNLVCFHLEIKLSQNNLKNPTLTRAQITQMFVMLVIMISIEKAFKMNFKPGL